MRIAFVFMLHLAFASLCSFSYALFADMRESPPTVIPNLSKSFVAPFVPEAPAPIAMQILLQHRPRSSIDGLASITVS